MAWAQAAGDALSFVGGLVTNSKNAREAQRNRDFGERLSNTAHQREVQDLIAAGLNPMISAMGGRGASTPEGAMARHENAAEHLGKAPTNALSAKLLQAQIANTSADTAKKAAETKVNNVTAANIENTMAPHIGNLEANTRQVEATIKNLGLEYESIFRDIYTKSAEYLKINSEARTIEALRPELIRMHRLENLAKELGIPLERNLSEAQKSWFKKNISPYLSDAEKVLDVAGSAAGGYLGARAAGSAALKGASKGPITRKGRGHSYWQVDKKTGEILNR